MIETASVLFGRSGYRRVSTRDIAAGAGVTPPTLQYYFDSKEGLYFACVDRVTSKIAQRVDPVLRQAATTLGVGGSNEDRIEAISAIQDCLIDAFYTDDEGPRIRQLVDEEEDLPETRKARYLMRDRVNLPIFRVVSPVIGQIIGRPADDLQTGLHSFAVFGQVMTFHQDQARLSDALGWSNPTPASIQLLKTVLRRQTALVLHGLQAGKDS